MRLCGASSSVTCGDTFPSLGKATNAVPSRVAITSSYAFPRAIRESPLRWDGIKTNRRYIFVCITAAGDKPPPYDGIRIFLHIAAAPSSSLPPRLPFLAPTTRPPRSRNRRPRRASLLSAKKPPLFPLCENPIFPYVSYVFSLLRKRFRYRKLKIT